MTAASAGPAAFGPSTSIEPRRRLMKSDFLACRVSRSSPSANSAKEADVPPAKTKIAAPSGCVASPSTNSPSCIGARKCRSQPSGAPPRAVSNSSQNTSGSFCRSVASRAAWNAAARRSSPANCERLNSITSIWPGSSAVATCLTANDLPAPGGPKTATESGRLTRRPVWYASTYSAMMPRMLRMLSISARSTDDHAPTVSMGMPDRPLGPSRATRRAVSSSCPAPIVSIRIELVARCSSSSSTTARSDDSLDSASTTSRIGKHRRW